MDTTTTQYKIEVMQAFLEGKQIETRNYDNELWHTYLNIEPGWNWQNFDYRVKQTSPLIIPWEALKADYRWAAKDEDGEIYVYTEKPKPDSLGLGLGYWRYEGLNYRVDAVMITQDPDNIGWKESLIQRPE